MAEALICNYLTYGLTCCPQVKRLFFHEGGLRSIDFLKHYETAPTTLSIATQTTPAAKQVPLQSNCVLNT